MVWKIGEGQVVVRCYVCGIIRPFATPPRYARGVIETMSAPVARRRVHTADEEHAIARRMTGGDADSQPRAKEMRKAVLKNQPAKYG